MRYLFFIVDVFTDTRFGGNPLAVLPEARGLSDRQMQAITREFNFSETTFVLPPDDPANDAKVRIFTPAGELPFAGHPNIGTAHALAAAGPPAPSGEQVLRFEQLAGVVPVRVRFDNGAPVYGELTAPQRPQTGPALDNDTQLAELADLLSLQPGDIATDRHRPCRASVGTPFLCVELQSLDALARSALQAAGWGVLSQRLDCRGVLQYVRDGDADDGEQDIRCRMYTVFGSVIEDPATGSANCALAGLLAELSLAPDATLNYRIDQGVEMGRPSTLLATAEKRAGAVTAVRIGGASVSVAEGRIEAG